MPFWALRALIVWFAGGMLGLSVGVEREEREGRGYRFLLRRMLRSHGWLSLRGCWVAVRLGKEKANWRLLCVSLSSHYVALLEKGT